MADGAGAYLVIRLPDDYGERFSLVRGQRHRLGRADSNTVVLKDELCSREHAEVVFRDGRWRLRDLGSLNGTRLNGERLDSEWELASGDRVGVGRTDLVFVESLNELPPLSHKPASDGAAAIKKRLGETRFLTTESRPVPQGDPLEHTPPVGRHRLNRDLALLYRLALDMGSATNSQDLSRIVLDGLLEGIAAEVGAILTLQEGRQLELSAYRHRDPSVHTYHKVSDFVSNEVLSSREAILADDVASDRHLQNRESLTELGATSLICAPISFGERIFGLIHLYSTDVTHPLDAEDLEFAVAVAKQLGGATQQLQRQVSLRAENRSLRDQLRVESELVGSSQAIKDIESQIARVANTHATVLIRGESGTGKELVARALHFSSSRKEGPFICLNCAALTETLLESELFGHEKGAFTGATDKKIGKFEAANHGTIFLDEIGEMKPGTQAKLLRVLEGHPFERVGGQTPIRTDVRVVSATNQPLEQNLQAGAFRRDLFFRLQVVEIRVPPLRDRLSDIGQLAEHFLRRFVQETGRKLTGFTPSAVHKMEAYHWPGNVRELRNVVERAVALGNGPMLDAADIWLSSIEANGPAPSTIGPYRPLSLSEIERVHILDTLQHTDWNKSQAATILQIERSTLDRKIKLYEIKR
jgi:Nif-specific regulatory protein